MYMLKLMKTFWKQHKVDITRWLYLIGIPFNVSTSSEIRDIYEKHYDNYTVLIRIIFSDNVPYDYQRFVIDYAEKLKRGIQKNH